MFLTYHSLLELCPLCAILKQSNLFQKAKGLLNPTPPVKDLKISEISHDFLGNHEHRVPAPVYSPFCWKEVPDESR